MFTIIPTPADDFGSPAPTASPPPPAQRTVETLPGGTVRVSTPLPPPSATQTQQTNSAGTFQLTSDGEVRHIGYASTTISSSPYTGSVAATGRSNFGPVSRVIDSTSVELPGGLRTTAEVAAKIGYFVRQSDGSYVDAPAATTQQQGQQQPPHQEQQQADLDAAVLDDDEVAEYNRAVESVSDAALAATTARVIAASASGDPAAWEKAAVELARAVGSGLEPGAASEMIEKAYNAYEGAVTRAVAHQIGGVSVEARQAFHDWLYASVDRSELQQAITRLVHENSVSDFKKLAARYSRRNG